MPFPHLLSYSRTRTTSVERPEPDTLRAACRLQDNLMEAEVEITVRLPDLDITAVQSRVLRDERGLCPGGLEGLENAVGVRIGPGMAKIIKGLVGDDFPCPQLVFMVEECCHGVILYFTKDELRAVPEDEDEAREHFARMIRKNIRLYNRCAAFAPGSSITEGIDPPSPHTQS
ncbi:MAG: hypothetical protein K9M82_02545 [Deltaproteobacteria bacterium]|nr:hypothetical protein [Deltaproteobacteria bacterium]